VFHFDPSIQQLPVSREAIAYLAESSNQPIVAVPGRQAQAAQAFAVAIRTSAETCSFYVVLWLAVAKEPAVWVYETRHLPISAIAGVADEAWNFCESMGFILDVVPIAQRSAAEVNRILARLRREEEGTDELPVPVPAPAAPTVTPGPSAGPGLLLSPAQLGRLGRLLASF